MSPSLQTVTQLLTAPAAFFEERPPADTLPIATMLVGLFALAATGGVVLVGNTVAGAIDATVENPDRPPEWACDMHADAPDSPMHTACDEPAERDASEVVQDVIGDYLWVAFLGPIVLWLLGGGVLYAAGRAAGGTPSGAGTLALAGWATLPEFLRLAAGVATVHLALTDVTITDLERADVVVEAALAPVEPVLLGVTLLTTGWQWYLLTGGLTCDAELPWQTAAVSVGLPLGLGTLVGIV